MNRDEVERTLRGALRRIAPDVEEDALTPEARFREDLELDSFDFLQLIVALSKTLGIDVPEADYGKLVSYGGAIDYLAGRT